MLGQVGIGLDTSGRYLALVYLSSTIVIMLLLPFMLAKLIETASLRLHQPNTAGQHSSLLK